MAEISSRPLVSGMRSLCLRSKPSITCIAPRNTTRGFHHNTSRPSSLLLTKSSTTTLRQAPSIRWTRTFTTTPQSRDWLQPKRAEKSKSRVGRPRMPTGGSMRGTTVVWGDYGLRMRDHDRRVSAKQLKIGEQAIRQRLRGMSYQLYTRVSANIGVYTKGNEVRMGKGKGKFDYWAARIAVSRIIFELKGDLHEKVVRDAFRLAGHKLPGLYEFVKKGDAPVVGITKLTDGVTLESLKDARRPVEPKDKDSENSESMVTPPTMTSAPPQTVSTSM